MAVARQRLMTLAYGEFETLLTLPSTYNELVAVAQDWTKPPPDAAFNLRIPVDYSSIQAARLVAGPYIYLTGDDSYQIAVAGVQGTRVEIVSDEPLPVEPPQPPPPPVLDMPGFFDLELAAGRHVALDVTINSDELDMSRMEDGTLVDGKFRGTLDIVHSGDTHTMEFNGTRLPPAEDYAPVTKLTTAKCHLTILTPEQADCEVMLVISPFWKLGIAWPPPEHLEELKIRYSLCVYPGGALAHSESGIVTTALYYEAIPAASMVDPTFIAPRNGFAMSFQDFVPHLMDVLNQLGMSIHARTAFINNNISAFSAHKNIAYRFLSPNQIVAAIDINVTVEPCYFTRIFLVFRGLNDDEVGVFSNSGVKEANTYNWRGVVAWSENAKDNELFRVVETAVLEIT